MQVDKVYVDHTGWASGDVWTFDIVVHNASDEVAYDVEVHDMGGNGFDPATVEYLMVSQGEIEAAGSERTTTSSAPAETVWFVGEMEPRGYASATITVLVADEFAADEFYNLVYTLNPSNPDPVWDPEVCQPTGMVDPETGQRTHNVEADTDQCDIESFEQPRLPIDKRVESQSGNTVDWRITVRNDGPFDITGVVVADEYPEGTDLDSVTVVEGPDQGSFDVESGEWTIGDMAVGQVVTMVISTTIDRDTLLGGVYNTAIVSSPDVPQPVPSGPDGDCGVNEGSSISDSLDSDDDQCDRAFAGAADLKINKETASVDVAAGADTGTVTWVIQVGNYGGADATETVVYDTLPESYIGGSLKIVEGPSKGTFDVSEARWDVGTMAPGETAEVVFSTDHPTSALIGTVVNLAVIDSPDSTYCPVTGESLALTGDVNGDGVIDARDCTPMPCEDNDTLAGDTTQCDISTANWTPPAGALPNTGAWFSLWVLALAGLLVGGGAGAVAYAARRRRDVADAEEAAATV